MINKMLILKKGETHWNYIPWYPDSWFFWNVKEELKAEISNFSNIFFAEFNISEVNFVKLFSLVYCFLWENYVRSWIFPAFATSSLWAQKLNQQPAVTYDMGKRDFVIKRNTYWQIGNHSNIQQHSNSLLWLAEETSGCFFMGRSRMSSPYHTS